MGSIVSRGGKLTVNSMKVFVLIFLLVLAGLSIAAPAVVKNGNVSSEESPEESSEESSEEWRRVIRSVQYYSSSTSTANGDDSSEDSSEDCTSGMGNCQGDSSSSSSSSEEGTEADAIKIEDIQHTIKTTKPKHYYFFRTALNPFYQPSYYTYNVLY